MSRFIGYEPCPKCRERGSDRAGDNVGVYDDGSKHCYSCGWHSFPSIYNQLKQQNETQRAEDKAKLPDDFTRHVPARAWQWLLQYGIPVSYWEEHCGYSEAEERLIIRVGNPLDFSLGRDMAIPKEGEKPRRKWYAYGNCHQRSHIFGNAIGTSGRITIVEDVISAHKVAFAGGVSLPLFGTNVHDCHLRTLVHLGSPINLWLDPDQEGLSIKRSIRLNALTNLPVYLIKSAKDPKETPLQQIKELIT